MNKRQRKKQQSQLQAYCDRLNGGHIKSLPRIRITVTPLAPADALNLLETLKQHLPN